MRVLLDTTVIILFDNDEKLLSPRALSLLRDKNNIVYLSAASIWEISIKSNLGKLQIQESIESLVRRIRYQYKIRLLPITPEVIIAQHSLPQVAGHKDPFDRLIIAHAKQKNLTLVARDSWFHHYPVKVTW